MAMAMNFANKSSQFCCDLASIPGGKSRGMIKSSSRENAATNKPNRVFAGPRTGTERNGQRRPFSSRVDAIMGSVIDPLLGSHQAGGAHHDESNYEGDDRDACDWRKDFCDILGKQIGDNRIHIKLLSNPASDPHH